MLHSVLQKAINAREEEHERKEVKNEQQKVR